MTGSSSTPLARFDRLLAQVEIAVASVALGVGLLVSLYTIASRALLVPTAEWVLELPMELLAIASIYGSGYLISRNRHLSVDIVVRRLSARGEWWIAVVTRVGLGVLSVFLAERAVKAAVQAARVGLTIPELFDLPTAVPMGVAAVGFALWAVHFGVLLTKPAREGETGKLEDGSWS